MEPDGRERRRVDRVVIVITLLSLAAHLWQLGRRPLAHDEAIDAWFSWRVGKGELIRYDPTYHGPLRFYLNAAVMRVFGTGPDMLRLVAALAGVGVTALIATSRRLLGTTGATIAALLTVISPTILTVTRTGREDSLTALVSLGLLLVVARLIVEPSGRLVVMGGALLGVSWSIKETTWIFGFAGACFVGGSAVVATTRRGGQTAAAWRRIMALGWRPVAGAVAAFLSIIVVVFTGGFRYNGVWGGLSDGLRYWLGQHDVGRGGQPWFFYLVVHGSYEWLIVGLAVCGLVVSWRRRRPVGLWFAVMWLGQLAVYSWAGEKFAWLALHPLIPAVLLAGIGAESLVRRARRWAPFTRRLAAGFAIVALGGTATSAIRPAITDGHDPAELLVAVHTTPDVVRISDLLHQLSRQGRLANVLVDQRDGGSWPWAWYLHDVPGTFYQEVTTMPAANWDAMILSGDRTPVAEPGYTVVPYILRAWWVPRYPPSAGEYVRWFFTRHPWNETGGSKQFLVIRSALL